MSIHEQFTLMTQVDAALEQQVSHLPLSDQESVTFQLTALKVFLAEQIEKEHNKRPYDKAFVKDKIKNINEYLAALTEITGVTVTLSGQEPEPESDYAMAFSPNASA